MSLSLVHPGSLVVAVLLLLLVAFSLVAGAGDSFGFTNNLVTDDDDIISAWQFM